MAAPPIPPSQSPPPQRPLPRPRNRDATATVILEAAIAALAEDGFASFGVNAVARRARCDKQLIYRYFGGLDGLLEAIGADLAETLAQDLAAHVPPSPASYGALMAATVGALIDVYRRHPVLRQIFAWEVASPTPAVQKLAAARSRQLMAWAQALRGDRRPEPGIDVGAVNASLFAAAQHLAVAGTATGSFAGVTLQTEEDWARVKQALAALAAAAYAAGEPDPANPLPVS